MKHPCGNVIDMNVKMDSGKKTQKYGTVPDQTLSQQYLSSLKSDFYYFCFVQ